MGAAFGGITRRGALTGVLGIAAGAVLTACGDETPSADAPPANGELVIGANLELSGPGSTFGKLQEQALLVGTDEINSTGIPFGDIRLRIRLVIKDNGGSAETAGRLVEGLIDQDKVSAIVGGTLVETARAMLTVAEQRKVPLLCLNSGDQISVPLPERRFIYQLGPNSSDVAMMMAREIRRQGRASVATLATADGHGESGVQALPRAMLATGREYLGAVRLPRSGRAFNSAAAHITDLDPDAVVVWSQAPVASAAVASLRKAGYAGKIFLDPGAGADDTLAGADSASMEGALIVHPTVLAGAPLMATTPSGRAARAFIYRYIQRYGTFGGFAPYGADALNLLATAARRAVSVDPRRLRGRLEAGALEGIAGAYDFQPISHGGLESDALGLFTARQGTWVRL